jgi:hypothetical protein
MITDKKKFNEKIAAHRHGKTRNNIEKYRTPIQSAPVREPAR